MPDEPKNYEEVTEVSEEQWGPLTKDQWTEPERWVWEQVRTGRVANFNERYDKELDPKKEELWNEKEIKQRGLRPDFLRTILLSQPWRGLITHEGVVIVGSCFEKLVNLSHAEIDCLLGFVGSRITAGMFCPVTRFKYSLGLQGSFCEPALVLASAEIKQDLFLGKGSFASANMGGLRVGGQLAAEDTAFVGELALNQAEINRSLLMSQGRFASARLHGVHVGGQLLMSGAEFTGELTMDGAVVEGGLFMDDGHFASVRLRGARIEGQLSMVATEFSGVLLMDGAVVKGALFMSRGSFTSAILRGVLVETQLEMEGVKFGGELSMDGAMIKDCLIMVNGQFASVELLGVSVLGQLLVDKAVFLGKARFQGLSVGGEMGMVKSVFKKELVMDRASIKATLFVRYGHLANASFNGMSVDGQLDFEGTVFKGTFSMDRAVVKRDLFFRASEFENTAQVTFTNVMGNLNLVGASFEALDLRGTCVGQSVIDGGITWPDPLELEGFTYQHLGGMGEGIGGDHMTDRPVSWFRDWLAKQKKYSPLPYQQCAKVLREAGQPGKANEVLYAGKERERLEAAKKGEKGRYWWLTFLWATIGYGLGKHFFRNPAIIAGILWGVGLIFCAATPEEAKHSFWWCMGYSLNRLIPLVDLHPSFKTAASLNFFPAAWFMFQTLCGWFLAALIIAGLAGVGKPGGRES